jgi:glucose/arabinose dehydrogenase
VWGEWRNAFVVAFDGAQRLDLVKLAADGRTPNATPVLERLGVGFKAVAQGPDGLYVMTSGKPGGDEIWRLTPQ